MTKLYLIFFLIIHFVTLPKMLLFEFPFVIVIRTLFIQFFGYEYHRQIRCLPKAAVNADDVLSTAALRHACWSIGIHLNDMNHSCS